MILIGYSGHSYVVHGILHAQGINATGYCDTEEKKWNPFSLTYFGKELSDAGLDALAKNSFFIAIGNNSIRHSIFNNLAGRQLYPINAIHPGSFIDPTAQIASQGVMVSAHVSINAFAQIGTGVICNTGCIIEHECKLNHFVHIGPGAVLCGNVSVGENSFVGAGAVVKEGIVIGKNAMIGAGSVVVKDVPDNQIVAGNPAGLLVKK